MGTTSRCDTEWRQMSAQSALQVIFARHPCPELLTHSIKNCIDPSVPPNQLHPLVHSVRPARGSPWSCGRIMLLFQSVPFLSPPRGAARSLAFAAASAAAGGGPDIGADLLIPCALDFGQ
eukprot:scaffold636_cov252-Pinguiococcus_pyrenoidosus.AAC.17